MYTWNFIAKQKKKPSTLKKCGQNSMVFKSVCTHENKEEVVKNAWRCKDCHEFIFVNIGLR